MLHASLLPFQNQVAIFNVCGDAEAFVFDFAALTAVQQAALVGAHLAAFEAN